MSKLIKAWLRGAGYALRFAGRPIFVGPRSRVSLRATVRIVGSGSIKIGRNTRIHDYAMLMSYGGPIEIGDDGSVNPFCVLYGHGGLKIGDGVRIASHSVIIPASHIYDDSAIPIWRQPETRLGIEIGDDVWIGTGVRVLDGVKIGRGCVIGAGAVVTKSLQDYSIAVGVPARIVGNRKESGGTSNFPSASQGGVPSLE